MKVDEVYLVTSVTKGDNDGIACISTEVGGQPAIMPMISFSRPAIGAMLAAALKMGIKDARVKRFTFAEDVTDDAAKRALKLVKGLEEVN